MKKILTIIFILLLFSIALISCDNCKHNIEIIPGKEATCTEDGLTDGGFAAAGFTHQTHGGTPLDLEGNAVNSLYIADGLFEKTGLNGVEL